MKVRNNKGGMVPLGSLASIREVNGPMVVTRYNMYPAAGINGAAAPGMSSAQAIDLIQRLAEHQLPKNMAYEWTDMSYLEVLAGNTATILFGFAVVMVFLVLAAQYESWSLPLAVILVVPMCLLSALIGVSIARMDVNIFTRIGFVVLVGLASKNAILIVEFAKNQRLAGLSRREATLAACQLRLRPIIMTSFAFILGVVPLIVSRGAGAEMRQTLGTAVFSGMLGVTMFGLILTPIFFSTIDWFGEWKPVGSPAAQLAVAVAVAVLVGIGLLGTGLYSFGVIGFLVACGLWVILLALRFRGFLFRMGSYMPARPTVFRSRVRANGPPAMRRIDVGNTMIQDADRRSKELEEK
jgi:Cu/Ag efflux pump CusA